MHVYTDLSAYLDAELAPADRARVDDHLAGCAVCRGRLAELRATASLVSALPEPRPSRSLVPHVTQRRSWLRPMRALSAIATGAFLFAFMVTAVGRYGGGLGGGDASTAIFGGSGAATAAGAPAASAAPAAPKAASAAPFFAPAPAQPTTLERSGPAAQTTVVAAQRSGPLFDPLFWLGLAVIAAVIAIAAHQRLRAP